jgi:hypothetical protein
MACHFIQVRSHGINISGVSLLPSFFAWAGQHGVLSKLGALIEPEQQNMFLSKSYCGHRRRERSLGLVACGSLPGNRMQYPVASQFMDAIAQICRSRNRESHAASKQSFILMIQRSLAGVNRVEARDEWS